MKNIVLFKCNKCRRQHSFETVTGNKDGLTYKLEYAPKILWKEIVSKFPIECIKCKNPIKVRTTFWRDKFYSLKTS